MTMKYSSSVWLHARTFQRSRSLWNAVKQLPATEEPMIFLVVLKCSLKSILIIINKTSLIGNWGHFGDIGTIELKVVSRNAQASTHQLLLLVGLLHRLHFNGDVRLMLVQRRQNQKQRRGGHDPKGLPSSFGKVCNGANREVEQRFLRRIRTKQIVEGLSYHRLREHFSETDDSFSHRLGIKFLEK